MPQVVRGYERWMAGGARRDAADGTRRDLLIGSLTGCDLRLPAATRADCGLKRARDGARWYGSVR
jgi:hypothetical protein